MISLEHVHKRFGSQNGMVVGLDDVNLDLSAGQFVCIQGPSGSGKTTLLLTIGGMMRPSQGQVILNGKDLYSMSTAARNSFRAQQIGFVFQMFHLIPYLNVLDNVLLGATSRAKPRQQVLDHLDRVGLAHRRSHRPAELSAGERQRVAIARALLKDPALILADEPTGNLDSENAVTVLQLLDDYRQQGGTVLLVTHGDDAQRFADRIVLMRDGHVVSSEENEPDQPAH